MTELIKLNPHPTSDPGVMSQGKKAVKIQFFKNKN